MPRATITNCLTVHSLACILATTACEPAQDEPAASVRDGIDLLPPSPPPIPGSLADEALPPIFDRVTGYDVVPDLIVDEDSAIALGKALFWDMQAGSDGQACASCHFSAGADPRARNQLSPGLLGGDGVFNPTRTGQLGPNIAVVAADFPFHVLADPTDRDSPVLFDSDDVMSSEGVFFSVFQAVTPDGLADTCEVVADPPFQVDGIDVRRVEPRNSPTVVNAGFNFRNFWDGRANNIFNGVNPFGRRDPNAFVLEVQGGQVVQRKLEIVNASLASQAVGPTLSAFEMSCAGRGFHDVGRKLLADGRRPLAFQKVAPDDSVLGPLADSNTGLSTTYAALIQQSFAAKLWDSTARFDAAKNLVVDPDAPATFSLMETNFSLFWGLAIAAYERTLVADDTPFDRYRDGRDPGALGSGELAGLDVFMNQGKCINCHGTAMFTKASTLHLIPEAEEGGLVERMLMSEEHDLYTVMTEPSLPVNPPGKGKGKGAWALTLDVSASPQLVAGKIVPGVAHGAVTLSGGSTQCAYSPATMTLGVDKQKTRDVRIEADLVTGPGCKPHLGISLVDDNPTKQGAWIDQVTIDDGKGVMLFSGSAPAEHARIRQPALYDNGFYNIGVRPTLEDPGVGGVDPFGNPLSFTEQFVDMLLGKSAPDPFHVDPCRFEVPWLTKLDGVLFPGGFFGATTCAGALPSPTGLPSLNSANARFIADLRTAVAGAFKTPTLRNVAVTAPYMHGGAMATLEQVVEFYDRGGDFRNPELDPDITRLYLTPAQRADLVLFLESLTDPRVVYEQAPFDHPQLFVPNGVDPVVDVAPQDGAADQDLFLDGLEIPAVGKQGRDTPISTFLGLADDDLPPAP